MHEILPGWAERPGEGRPSVGGVVSSSLPLHLYWESVTFMKLMLGRDPGPVSIPRNVVEAGIDMKTKTRGVSFTAGVAGGSQRITAQHQLSLVFLL